MSWNNYFKYWKSKEYMETKFDFYFTSNPYVLQFNSVTFYFVLKIIPCKWHPSFLYTDLDTQWNSLNFTNSCLIFNTFTNFNMTHSCSTFLSVWTVFWGLFFSMFWTEHETQFSCIFKSCVLQWESSSVYIYITSLSKQWEY